MKKTSKTPHIGIISLGCPKALVDSEKIATQLIALGYQITKSDKKADLVLINTCGFINEAIADSFDTIATTLEKHPLVVVTGCLGSRKENLQKRFPTLTHISGPGQTAELLEAIQEALPLPHTKRAWCELPNVGVKFTPSHYAYLKISEGCNHHCSFCIIPQLRGPLRSRLTKDIVDEATQLVDAGVKELLIISQDTAAFGTDRHKRNDILPLLDRLSDLPAWIRLHYLYPYPILDSIIPLMADRRIIPYLDVPFQHVNPRILRLMKRPGSIVKTLERVDRWREICPDINIRSTLLVGFPGETEAEFQELLDFLEKAQLDRVGCFAYSAVEGAKANQFPMPIPGRIKQERVEALMTLQAAISAKNLAKKRGKTIEILVDEVSGQKAIGRSYADAPEIDGQVIITQKTHLKPGDFALVTITDSDEHDLYGKLASISRQNVLTY